MYLGVVMLVLLGLVGYWGQLRGPAVGPETSLAPALAANALIYHRAVVAYSIANPAVTGTVATASLTLPGWYASMGYWVGEVEASGAVVTRDNGTLPIATTNVAKSLAAQSAQDVGAGIVVGGMVVPWMGTAVVAAPADVPAGSLALVTQAH